jgi:hyperosmotically inducible protein
VLTACAATASRTTDDLTTSTQVKIALLNDSQVGGLRLDVRTFQGVVTLSGTVRSQAQADQAVAVARKVRGVRSVRPELKVEGSQ